MDFAQLVPGLRALSSFSNNSHIVTLSNVIFSALLPYSSPSASELKALVQTQVLNNLTFQTPLALSRFVSLYNLIASEYFSKISRCQEFEDNTVANFSCLKLSCNMAPFVEKHFTAYITFVFGKNKFNYTQELFKGIRRGAEIIIHSPCNNTPTSFHHSFRKRPMCEEAQERMKIMWEEKLCTGDPDQCYVTEREKSLLVEEFGISLKTITIS